MNRRELIAAGVAAAVGVPAAAQQSWKIECTPENCLTTTVSPLATPRETNVYGSPKEPTAEEEAYQYPICQQRGHAATRWGNMHPFTTTVGTFIGIPDGPSKVYPNVGASEWQTCWHCKTRYRFVTTMEEEGKP